MNGNAVGIILDGCAAGRGRGEIHEGLPSRAVAAMMALAKASSPRVKSGNENGQNRTQDDAQAAADPKQVAAPQAQDAHRLEDDVICGFAFSRRRRTANDTDRTRGLVNAGDNMPPDEWQKQQEKLDERYRKSEERMAESRKESAQFKEENRKWREEERKYLLAILAEFRRHNEFLEQMLTKLVK